MSVPNTSPDAGSSTMVTGTGGMIGGTGGVSSAPVKPSFRAHVDGDDVIIETSGQAWFAAGCGEPLDVDKRAGDAWTPLRDDRPQPSNGHIDDYFLDGEYVAARDFDCNVPDCARMGATVRAGSALEFVKIGTRLRPNDVGLPPGEVPFVETRPYRGEVAASLTYSETSDCRASETTIVTVPGSAQDIDADAGR